MTQHPFLPVPVQNRADGWTPEKQWKFVEALAQTASITDAVRAVGMTRRSAHRLRMHPEATEFRAAWDAALRQGWGLLEQVALDRAVNGEREIIERHGYVVAERRKPCSDRLMMFLLASRERALAAERAERAAAHKVALAEAKLAALKAGADAARAAARRRGKDAAVAPAPPPPLPVLPDDAAAATAELRAFHDHGKAFAHWPELDEEMAGHRALTAANAAADATPTDGVGPEDDDVAAVAGFKDFDFGTAPRGAGHAAAAAEPAKVPHSQPE